MSVKEEVEKLVHKLEELEPELLENFIAYWTIKKSPYHVQADLLNKIKSSESNLWLNLIEANHKFRITYGDTLAKELIKVIEDEKNLNKSG